MIRQLTARDHPRVTALLEREPEINLFIIGDIENLGYEHPRVRHWGDFDPEGRPVAVLTHYFDTVIFYARQPYDLAGFLQLLATLDFRFLAAEASILAPFAERFAHIRRKDTWLARLERPLPPEALAAAARTRPATLADVEAIVALRREVPEFEVVPDHEMLTHILTHHEGRAFVIEEAGRLVSVAQSSAESARLAMIVGVCTAPGLRQRGLATACTARLCQALLAEGKTPCLFYDNPAAGRIYKRLGFEDIARWSMLLK